MSTGQVFRAVSVAGNVAIAVAERVERTGGARAGLVAWKTLASNAADGDTRGKALLAGLHCTVTLRDAYAAFELVTLWSTVDRGMFDVAPICRDLVRAQMGPQAIALAEAEATRTGTAHALYTHARVLDVARDPRAVEVFARAIAQAIKEGAADGAPGAAPAGDGATRIADASRLRRATLLARSWSTLGEALAEASKLEPARLEPAERIDLARVLLFAPSRFVRATALGLLGDAARADDLELRLRARRLAARYADEAGAGVTPLEQDRLGALFDLALKSAASGTLVPSLEPVVERARDILRGRYEVPRDEIAAPPAEPSQRRAHRHGELLDVVVAMRDRAPARAARSLRPFVEALRAGERLPAASLAVAHAALIDGDAELRDVAVELLRASLARPSYASPPRGFLGLADALALAGEDELSLTARRAAALRKEEGAVASLVTVLARVGWEAGLRHDRPHAIAVLREAKQLSGA